jgi:hypothetical protein
MLEASFTYAKRKGSVVQTLRMFDEAVVSERFAARLPAEVFFLRSVAGRSLALLTFLVGNPGSMICCS